MTMMSHLTCLLLKLEQQRAALRKGKHILCFPYVSLEKENIHIRMSLLVKLQII